MDRYYSKIERTLQGILCVLCILALISSSTLPCFAAEASEQVDDDSIRVAYFDCADYYQLHEDGKVESYDTEYLERISEYTGLNFTFVDCGTWSNAMEMLRDQKVDLLGTMQKSEAREENFSIGENNYGITLAEIVALPGSDYEFEDYTAIGDANIGVLEDYVRMEELNALFAQHQLSPQLTFYATQEELLEALENHQVDMVAANSHTLPQDWKVIEKYFYSSFYFATWQGNEMLVHAIDEALLKINLYASDVDSQLIKNYFQELVQFPYTKEELDCMEENQTYTIYFDADMKPLVWYDSQTDSMQGILIDICTELEKTTGLHFLFRPDSEYPDHPGEYDVIYRSVILAGGDYEINEAGMTDAVLNTKLVLYHRVGYNYQADSGNYTIALPGNRDGLIRYAESTFPTFTIKPCQTPEEALELLSKGKVDFALISEYVASSIVIQNNLDNLAIVPSEQADFYIGIQFHGERADLLSGIIDKGLSILNSNTVNKIIVRYAMETMPNTTLSYLVKSNTVAFVGIIAILLILLFSIGAAVLYARTMKKQAAKIAAANEAKNRFFSQMSHDMRTPMNGILGIAQLAESENDAAALRESIGKIKDSGQYLLGLINDTLDFQRIESGKMDLEPHIVDYHAVTNSIVDITRRAAEEKGILFKVTTANEPSERYCKMDDLRIKQMLLNLLSNAVKFTPKGGTVELHLECLSREGMLSHILVIIRDTGIGMSKEFLQNHIFQPFAQERNEVTGMYAGSGLGLSITKHLVELMGGRIEADSELGSGTEFRLYFDIELVEKEKAEKLLSGIKKDHSNAIHALAGRHILLCEDHPLNAEIARRLLEKAGCSVTWAKDGKEGVNLFSESVENTFDAILMDIRMPVMDGLEAAKAIRALPRADARNVPIIAMTANAYAEDIRKSLDSGMNAHLAKPVEPAKLYDTLEQTITQRGKEMEPDA